MPIEDYRVAATTISEFLKLLVSTGGLRLKYRITAGEGAADPDGLEAREIYVEIAGPDAPLVTQRNGELLRALEHIAAKMVRLEPEEHDRIYFDSGNFKAMRAREMKMAADAAAERVRRSGAPYSFQPMSSRERRMLHLAFRQFDDLETESSGEGMRRFVVVYRKGEKHVPPVAAAPSFQRGGRGGRDSRGGGRGPGRGGGRGPGRGDDRRGGGRGGDRRGPRR
jgi:spoIIIJ-associated protein